VAQRKLGWIALWFSLAAVTGILSYEIPHWDGVPWRSIAKVASSAQALATAHPIVTGLAFAILYVVSALALFPAQLWVIVVGGFLFGLVLGGIASWCCAMLGAVAVFVAARTVFGLAYMRTAGPLTARIAAEFERDPTLIMLSLRWLPVSPYALANVAPPLLGAAFAPFMCIAAIGILPDIVTYSIVGATLRRFANMDHAPRLNELTSKIGPLLVLVGAAPVAAMLLRRLLGLSGSGAIASIEGKLTSTPPPAD
jgi:uncharacterized membrane protein YdjX (TVP38/TMEM64 family)